MARARAPSSEASRPQSPRAKPSCEDLDRSDVATDPCLLFAKRRAADLWEAASYGTAQAVTELCSSFQAPMYINEGTGQGATTPLMAAVQAGRSDVVHILLDAGADADAVDARGRTALMHAAACGEAGLFGPLMARGADVSPKAHNGWTSLMFACTHSHWVVEPLLELMRERRDGQAPLGELEWQSALGVARAHEQHAVVDLLEGWWFDTCVGVE